MLNARWSLLRTREISHLTLHFNGIMVDGDVTGASGDFGSASEKVTAVAT